MKRVKNRLLSIFLLGILFVSLVMSNSSVSHAQTGGSGLSISPTRHELTINKGAAETITVSIKNISGVAVVAKAVVNDFEASNDSGEPKLIVDPNQKSPTSIRDFLLDVSDVSLANNETKKLVIPVQIPGNTPSGAYYGVIRYTAQKADDGSNDEPQVALNASLGVIVLIQVPGSITEQIQALSLKAERDEKPSSFFFSAPTHVSVSLKNVGTGFVKPFGRVTIKKGSKELYSYEMNNVDPRSNILPGSTRTFKDEVKDIKGFGRYTITTNLSYGKGGDIITMKSSFWIVPVWLLALIALFFLVLIVLAILAYKWVSRAKKRRRR